jgi:hypothetical protein
MPLNIDSFRKSPVGVVSVDGQTTVIEQFFKVSLFWLIMPFVIWLSTTFLLITAIWNAWKKKRPLWKTSTLPTLLDVVNTENKLGSGNDLVQRAGKKNVMLNMHNIGEEKYWHLVVTNKPQQ